MLVLTRKRGETIRIDQDVVVKVIHLGKGTVKLGIEAPADVRVLRGELQEFDTPPKRTLEVEIAAEDLEVEAFLANFNEMFDLTLLTEEVSFWSPERDADAESLELVARG